MTDVILDIQNVKQTVDVQDVKVKKNPNFSAQLRELIVEQKQEELPDGKIRITMILDPKIKEVNHG